MRILALLTVFLASVALADTRRVLHEDVPSPGKDLAGPHVLGPAGEKNPSAVGAEGKLLPAPDSKAPPKDQEIIHGRGGFGADRSTEFSADRQTGGDGTLYYSTVFNPTVIPFKRMAALDTVEADQSLAIAPGPTSPVPLGGEANKDDELFWGDLLVDLTPGASIPIPSVSPDMRVLSYEITPPVALTFSKDGADNISIAANATGPHRLVFLAAAPKGYFNPSIPSGFTLRSAKRFIQRNHGELLRPLPPAVKADADRAVRRLGIRDSMPLSEALGYAVSYFRAFTAKPAPRNTGNVFVDLYSSQAGVCRHRSFAFIIVVQAMGLPARFVSNEAHAFTEIWLPDRGWMRVDLGGAAMRLEVQNAGAKTMHTPEADDPFPQPREYAENYTQWSGDLRGLNERQLDEARAGLTTQTNDDVNGDTADDRRAAPAEDAPPSGPPPISPDAARTLDEIPEEEIAGKVASSVTVTSASTEGYRGESIVVAGTVALATGRPADGVPVDVWLRPGRGEPVHLGRTTARANGEFSSELSLPATLALESYEVIASTPGNDRVGPSVSR